MRAKGLPADSSLGKFQPAAPGVWTGTEEQISMLYNVIRLCNLRVCEAWTETIALISCLALSRILNVPSLQFSHLDQKDPETCTFLVGWI